MVRLIQFSLAYESHGSLSNEKRYFKLKNGRFDRAAQLALVLLSWLLTR